MTARAVGTLVIGGGWMVLVWGLWRWRWPRRGLPKRVPGETLARIRRQHPPTLDAFTMWLAESTAEERARFMELSRWKEHPPSGGAL